MGAFFVLVLIGVLVPAAILGIRWALIPPSDPRALVQRRRMVRWIWIGASVDLLLILLAIAGPIYVETEWFTQLGFGEVYWTVVVTAFCLAACFALVAALVLYASLRIPIRALPPVHPPGGWKLGYPALLVGRHVLTGFAALGVGLYASSHWQEALLFLHGADTGEVDPIFGNDVGFYLFRYPFWIWAINTLAIVLVASLVLAGALTAGLARMVFDASSMDKATDYVLRVVRAGMLLLLPLLLLQMGRLYLGHYGLLTSTRGRIPGISYVDHHVSLPLYWVYLGGYLGLACAIGWLASRPHARGAQWLAAGSGLVLLLCWALGTGVTRWAVQAWVHSNELAKEGPYLDHAIAATKKAYGIDTVDIHEYHPKDKLTYEDLKQDPEALDNIRLWDWNVLEATYQETQGIRPYYRFPDIDVDRYMVAGQLREVMLGSREIDMDKLPKESRTWNNLHLVYTHGYGVCMNEASEFTRDGMPRMHIKDIPPHSDIPELQVKRPEIYFGELTKNHVYVNTTAEEFSYPGDSGNVFHRYEGRAGVRVGSGLRRLALAWRFDGFQQLLSNYIHPDSKLVWRREIHERIKALAPFLRLDSDTYKVIRDDGTLCYVQDAYTWSRTYPYAAPHGPSGLNYIRASVKITIDAYDGDVTFWVFDDNDPVLRAWSRAFPGLFRSRSEMPADLRRHVRYPEDLFDIQARILADYHMNAQDFNMREDRWQIARDLFKKDNQEVSPYYALLKLPGEKRAEFVLMLPFTPFGRHNLEAWLGGRCDGDNYGRLLLYRMPHQSLVWGPMQIDTKIDQDPEMAAQLALWKQKGADVIRGSLLVIPIAGGILYVEPIYLRADQVGMPQIRRVVVGFGDRVAWAENFDLALRRLFGKSGPSPVPGPGVNVEAPAQFKAASAELDRYLELMGQGRAAEAGKALEELRRILKGEGK